MNRAMRRAKHKLILVPLFKSPLPGLRLSPNQKQFTCICGGGWLTISGDVPTDAFDQHVLYMRGEQNQHVAQQ